MAEGVIYKHSVEAFINQVVIRRGLLSLEFDKELRALGCDVSRPREMKLEPWVAMLRATARRLLPGAAEVAALEEVGREMLRGYAEGLVGRALFMVLRLSGPRRALLRIGENFRTADSITEVKAVERGPTAIDLEFNDVVGGVPDYVRGVLLESLVLLKVKTGTVTSQSRPGGGVLFEVRWS